MMEKHIELAKKLKALADKGIGGEKQTAQEMLDALLLKHGLTMTDIQGEAVLDHFFKIKEHEIKLWAQIVHCVRKDITIYGEFPAKMIKDCKLSGNYMIKCTVSEFVEIDSMNHAYQRLYNTELELFYRAFVTANNLLVNSDTARSVSDLSPKEYEEYMRVKSLADKIKTETIRRQLTA